MKRYGLARRERITKKKEFNQVFTQGKILTNSLIIIRLLPNKLKYVRLGVIVSKKRVRQASQRNRIKRLIREAFRQNKHALPQGIDIIIGLRKTSGIELEHIKQKMLDLLAAHA